jgi:hypothetical protein
MQECEKLFPLVKAVEDATGRRVHLSTVLRWAQRGSRGVRLESRVLGGRRLTSVESVHRFMESTTRASEPVEVVIPSRGREREKDRAAKRLAEIVGVKK